MDKSPKTSQHVSAATVFEVLPRHTDSKVANWQLHCLSVSSIQVAMVSKLIGLVCWGKSTGKPMVFTIDYGGFL
jgi:hypothetical protein